VHTRYVCIALIVVSYIYIYPIFALHSVWGTTFSIPRFSLGCFENFLQVHSRDDRESISLLFYLNIVKPLSLRSGLLLFYMLGLNCLLLCVSMFLLFFNFIVFNKKKKKGGRRCRIIFFFRVTVQILYVFLPNISVHRALIEYAYIWLRVYVWYLLSFPVHLNTT
jgi:hypothetical protein